MFLIFTFISFAFLAAIPDFTTLRNLRTEPTPVGTGNYSKNFDTIHCLSFLKLEHALCHSKWFYVIYVFYISLRNTVTDTVNAMCNG